jgi:hypothetical protein
MPDAKEHPAIYTILIQAYLHTLFQVLPSRQQAEINAAGTVNIQFSI